MGNHSHSCVVIYRAIEEVTQDADVDSVIEADGALEAAAKALRSIGGGYADYVGVMALRGVDARPDLYGFVEDDCFMYCLAQAGEFSYAIRL